LKRRDLIILLEEHGWKFKRPGGNHDIYWKDGEARPIPVKRHNEIPDYEAQTILKQAGIQLKEEK